MSFHTLPFLGIIQLFRFSLETWSGKPSLGDVIVLASITLRTQSLPIWVRAQATSVYRMARSGLLLVLGLLSTQGSCRGPCDPLIPQYCILPFPNSFFTAPSSQTPTGVQVNFSAQTFPSNVFGRKVNPIEWNTLGESIDMEVAGVLLAWA